MHMWRHETGHMHMWRHEAGSRTPQHTHVGASILSDTPSQISGDRWACHSTPGHMRGHELGPQKEGTLEEMSAFTNRHLVEYIDVQVFIRLRCGYDSGHTNYISCNVDF